MPQYLHELENCRWCPRDCGVDRTRGELGYCRTGAAFAVGAVCLHKGEEPVLGGERGICNVFFTRCNMQCIYCQNYQISRRHHPAVEHVLSPEQIFAQICRFLDDGVRHVGFVSPSHCIPQMKELIRALESRTPRPIFVMNTNGYDSVETLRTLEGIIDIYLPDLKYLDSDLSARLSDAADYPHVATMALREMHRQKGSYLLRDKEGLALSGLIIRHLVLPGHVEETKRCLRFIAEELSPSVHVSLLAQYEPTPDVKGHPVLGRRLRPEEYEEAIAEMERLGFRRGWTQELDSARSYNPDFRARNPFAGP